MGVACRYTDLELSFNVVEMQVQGERKKKLRVESERKTFSWRPVQKGKWLMSYKQKRPYQFKSVYAHFGYFFSSIFFFVFNFQTSVNCPDGSLCTFPLPLPLSCILSFKFHSLTLFIFLSFSFFSFSLSNLAPLALNFVFFTCEAKEKVTNHLACVDTLNQNDLYYNKQTYSPPPPLSPSDSHFSFPRFLAKLILNDRRENIVFLRILQHHFLFAILLRLSIKMMPAMEERERGRERGGGEEKEK